MDEQADFSDRLFDDELIRLLKQALKQYLPKNIALDKDVLAYRFIGGELHPINTHLSLTLDDLLGIDTQKNKLVVNTEQFLQGLPANHVLMTGARGVGKSSLIKALLQRYAKDGLRIIEMGRDELLHLDELGQILANSSNDCKYIVYCDDLAFNSQDENYRTLKSVLDGSLASDEQILVYATSNRRHLLPQLMKDNISIYNGQTDEVNPYETIDETVSLSDRFGLWLSFHALTQDEYLDIVQHYITQSGLVWTDDVRTQALLWASTRGGRSGRIAYQFSKDLIGKSKLHLNPQHKHIHDQR